jgi:thiol-disulfide isomerase/thioredoxin
MSIKPIILSITLLFVSTLSIAQELKFKVAGLQDTIVHLVKYSGKGMYYADTTNSVNGVVKFDGKKHKTGVYALFLPGQKYFDFIHDNEVVDISVASQKDLVGSLSVKKSKSNIAFYDYIHLMTQKRKEATKLNAELAAATGDEKQAIQDKLTNINTEITTYQKQLVADHKGKFLADLISMSIDVALPEPPRDENGVITDSTYVYQFYVNHYWDKVNLKNEDIIRTPLFHKKLEAYLSKNVLIQNPDTISLYADKLIDKVDTAGFLFQYIVAHVTSTAEQSEMMGMENVFVHMADKYYCPKPTKAHWMTQESLDKLCKRVDEIRPTIIGAYAPRLCLPDSTEKNWIDLYKVDAKYKIVYFWEPTCGHCKKATPKLQDLYANKFKERGVEVYAVGKAMGEEFEKWKDFIVDNELTFINVGLTKSVYEEAQENAYNIIKNNNTTLESLNYSKTYDISSTPRIFVLDENNKILYKRLSISQLEEILDMLQGVPNAKKLYPMAEEDPEDREHAKD